MNQKRKAASLTAAVLAAMLLTGTAGAAIPSGTATGDGVAVGTGSATVDGTGVAIGTSAKSGGATTMESGESITTGKGAVGIGYANAVGDETVAIGSYSKANTTGITAIGGYANRYQDVSTLTTNIQATTVGMFGTASGTNSLALGYYAQATADRSLALGYQGKAQEDFAIAVGRDASAGKAASIAMGYKAEAAEASAIAIGFGTEAYGENSAALGTNGDAGGARSVAFGSIALALGQQSTALGYGSDAHIEDSTVAGAHAYACAEGASGFGAYATAGHIFVEKDEDGNLKYMTDKNDRPLVGDADKSLALGAYSVARVSEDAEGVARAEASFGHSVGDVHTSGSHHYDSEKYNPYDPVVYTDEVNSRLTHVAEGVEDTDAANVSQLYRLNLKVGENTQAIHDLGNEIDGVGAMASALAGLHPLDWDEGQDKWQLAAAVGGYDGTSALALGGFYHSDEDTLFSGGISMPLKGRRKTAFNLGMTVRIGRDEETEKDEFWEEAQRIEAQLAERSKLFAERQRKMEALAAQIGALRKAEKENTNV